MSDGPKIVHRPDSTGYMCDFCQRGLSGELYAIEGSLTVGLAPKLCDDCLYALIGELQAVEERARYLERREVYLHELDWRLKERGIDMEAEEFEEAVISFLSAVRFQGKGEPKP